MIFKSLAPALLAAVTLSTASAQEIGGRYRVQGDNGNGTGYAGVAEISGTSGGNCSIRWSIQNTPPTQGFCMRQGNVFSAAYRMGDAIGLVVYRLADGGVLEGTWSIAGTEGIGKERLTPQR